MISGSFLRDPDHAKGSEEHLGPKRNARKRPLAARAYEVRGLGAWERLTIQALDEKKTKCHNLFTELYSAQWSRRPVETSPPPQGLPLHGDRRPGPRCRGCRGPATAPGPARPPGSARSLPPSRPLRTTPASGACLAPPELTSRASRKANTAPQNRNKKLLTLLPALFFQRCSFLTCTGYLPISRTFFPPLSSGHLI